MSTRAGAIAAAAAITTVALGAAIAAPASTSPNWELASAMSQRRSYIAAAELGGFVYAAGGMVGETGRPLHTFTRYDPRSDRWLVLPRLPEPTRAAAGAALDGAIYVVGGTTPAGNTSATWAFEPGRQTWDRRASLPAARFNHAAAELDGKLYVAGGYLQGRERREVFAYDPATDRWSLVARLPRPTHAFGLVAFRGELWVIGGRRGESVLREVWILNPVDLTWRRGPALTRPMELLGAAVEGEEVHAVWESTYQIYDAASGRWREGPRPLVTRHALEAFVVDDALYTVGGCTTALRDSPVVERLELR